MRKFLTAIAVLSLVLSISTAVLAEKTEGNAAQEAISILQKLDILDSDYASGDSMTRGEWAHIVSGVFPDVEYRGQNTAFYDVTADTEYADDINKLVMLGVLRGLEENFFGVDEEVTEEQAIVMLIRILGYEKGIRLKNPAEHWSTAASLGLMTGETADMALTDRLCLLLYNALNTHIMEQNGLNEFVISDDETLLNSELSVYTYTGVLKSVGEYSLSKALSSSKNQARVNDTTFNLNKEEDAYTFTQYLGCSAKWYYKKLKNDEYVLLFCTSNDKSEVTEIDLRDIISLDRNTVKYANASGKEKSVTFDSAAYIVYNGRPADGIPALGKSGSMRIVKNSSDYDCVIITDYITCVVDYVSVNNNCIVGMTNSIRFEDIEDTDSYRIHDIAQKSVAVSSLQKWDVLSAAVSIDKSYIDIFVSRKKANGTINSIDGSSIDDYQLIISETAYDVTDEFFESRSVSVGDYGKFYLDIFGRLAAFDKGDGTGLLFGFVINVYKDKDDDDTPKARILTHAGVIQEFEIYTKKNKLTVNGSSEDLDTFIAENSENGMWKRQLVRYKQDSEKRIKSFELAADSRCEGLFSISVGSQAYFRNASLSFNTYAMADAKTVVFLIPPESKRNDKSYYSVEDVNYFTGGVNYKGIKAYGCGMTKLTASALVYEREEDGHLTTTSAVSVVMDFKEEYDSKEDEILKGMTVLRAGSERSVLFPAGKDFSVTTRNPSAVQTPEENSIPAHKVEPGDVVRYPLNEFGQAGYVQLLYDKSEDKFLPSSNPLSYDSGSYKIGVGTVQRMDNDVLEIRFRSGEVNYYKVTASTYIVLCSDDNTRDSVRKGSLDDIRTEEAFSDTASKVFTHSTSGTLQTIVIYN